MAAKTYKTLGTVQYYRAIIRSFIQTANSEEEPASIVAIKHISAFKFKMFFSDSVIHFFSNRYRTSKIGKATTQTVD